MNFENPLKRVERLKKVTRRPDTDLGGRIPLPVNSSPTSSLCCITERYREST